MSPVVTGLLEWKQVSLSPFHRRELDPFRVSVDLLAFITQLTTQFCSSYSLCEQGEDFVALASLSDLGWGHGASHSGCVIWTSYSTSLDGGAKAQQVKVLHRAQGSVIKFYLPIRTWLTHHPFTQMQRSCLRWCVGTCTLPSGRCPDPCLWGTHAPESQLCSRDLWGHGFVPPSLLRWPGWKGKRFSQQECVQQVFIEHLVCAMCGIEDLLQVDGDKVRKPNSLKQDFLFYKCDIYSHNILKACSVWDFESRGNPAMGMTRAEFPPAPAHTPVGVGMNAHTCSHLWRWAHLLTPGVQG